MSAAWLEALELEEYSGENTAAALYFPALAGARPALRLEGNFQSVEFGSGQLP